jgi:hypothetical protein
VKVLLSLSLLLLLSSCGGHLQITNKGCKSSNTLFSDQDNEILYSGGFWLPVFSGHISKISLKEILKDKDIDCNQLSAVSYEVGHNFIDAVLSFLPLLGRSHITVRGSIN